MKRVTKKIQADASQIQERVALLSEQHSQSEISRRTRTPVSNVNRYINGTRIPADFCAALVQGMGVNPAWLLTGEGAPSLSDVTSGTERMAGDMLELVDALNAVSRMRLGSLTGKHHLRVLRELNEALRTYGELRTRLDERSGPILQQLTQDMVQAIQRRDLDVAEDMRKAGRQIADFCQDREQLRAFHAAEATLEFQLGNSDTSLRITRDVFARTLTGSDKLNKNAIIQAHNMVASLCQNYLFDEARRVSRAVIELAGDQLEGLEAHHEMKTLAGIVEVELGNLAEGIGLISTNFPRTGPAYLEHSIGPAIRAFLLSGFMSFDDVDAKGGVTLGKGRHLVRFAVWLEDAVKLESVLERYVGVGRDLLHPETIEAVQARLLLDRLKRKRKTGLKKALDELNAAHTRPLPDDVVDVLRGIYATQLHLAAGDKAGARKHLLKTEASIEKLQPEVSLDMLNRAHHCRNALQLLPEGTGDHAAMRHRANAFMREHLRRGYAFLNGSTL